MVSKSAAKKEVTGESYNSIRNGTSTEEKKSGDLRPRKIFIEEKFRKHVKEKKI